MNALIPAVAAIGVLLIWSGLTPRAPRSRRTRLAGMIQESGLGGLTPVRLTVLSILAGASVFVGVAGLTGALVPALVVSGASAGIPFLYVRSARDKRARSQREAWPDALATMIAGIRSGVALPEICSALATKGPEQLRASFGAYATSYRASGSFARSLDRLRDSAADPIADRVTVSLKLANEVGGTDLVRVLRTLADFVREDLRIRKEIEARWSWTVTAARVAAASPWIVLLIMATRPEAARAYDSPTGALVIACGAVATFLGYRAMLQAARLPEERRLER